VAWNAAAATYRHLSKLAGERRFAYWLCTSRAEAVPMDVSERDSGRELDALFDQAPVALALFDQGLRAKSTNAAFRHIAGLPDEAIVGHRLSEIDDGMDVALIERTLGEQVLKKGVAVDDVPLVQTLAGERRVLLWSAQQVTENGQVLGVLCRFKDVTRQATSLERAHALLERAGYQIGTTLNIEHTAGELADLAVPELADRVTIDLLDQVLQGGSLPRTGSDALEFRRVAVRDTSKAKGKFNSEEGDLFAAPPASGAVSALLQGKPLLARNPAEMTREVVFAPGNAEGLLAWGAHTYMSVPLIARGVTLGVAGFSRAEHPEPYGEAAVRLAGGLAARAAVCIDNARLYTREHTTAITLQRSLLPQHVPQVAWLQIAYRYQPASQTAEVGGDWFDVIPLGTGQVALVVGDVTGHGIQAAAIMGQLRTTTAALARLGCPPEEIMAQLSGVVADHGEETGATCLYAQYDCASRRCRLTSAGHPPPVLRHPDGTAEFIDIPGGVMLGVGPSRYPSTDIDLSPGGVLGLYTDGLIENPGQDIGAGMTRLALALAASPARSLDKLCDSVLASLGEGARDDIALLLARTTTETAR
jgi:PAS domain S-box-containing protein